MAPPNRRQFSAIILPVQASFSTYCLLLSNPNQRLEWFWLRAGLEAHWRSF